MIRSLVKNAYDLGDVRATTVNGRAVDPGALFMPTAAEFRKLLGFTPTALYRGDEYSGNAIDRSGAANDLTVAGTPAYDVVRGGKRGVRVTANTSGFSGAGVALGPANQNAVIGVWLAVDDAVAAQRTSIGYYATTKYLLASVQTSAGGGVANRFLIQSTDGAVAASFTIDKVVTDGVPRLLLVHRDRTMNTMRARLVAPNEAAVTGTADITTQGSLAGGASPTFNYGYVAGLQNGDDVWLGGAFAWIDAAATGANLLTTIAQKLGAE